MKTTKRSKMLLSSIAMLLVALVALGSATFAWYSINRNVYADTVKITASAPKGLEISLASGSGYTTDGVTLEGGDKTLTPAQLTFTSGALTAVKTGEAADSSNSTVNASGLSTVAAGDEGKYVFTDDVFVRTASDDGAKVNISVTATATGTGADLSKSYVRIAVIDATTNTVYQNVSHELASKTSFATNVDIPANNTPKTFHIYAWVDGEDSLCTTDSAYTLPVNFKVDFDLA